MSSLLFLPPVAISNNPKSGLAPTRHVRFWVARSLVSWMTHGQRKVPHLTDAILIALALAAGEAL
jgi:hypothetical protein